MKTIVILVGIPCSGKSTWAQLNRADMKAYIVSRDDIRENEYFFIQPFKICKSNEDKVTELFDNIAIQALNAFDSIILDNTHCKESYIDNVIKKYSGENIVIKFFTIPLWKAHYRNIVRYILDGKYIPFKIINNMYKNYNKINKDKYKKWTM